MPRSRIYEDPDDFEKKVDDYFELLSGKPPTLAGLCVHLGFNSRDTLWHYGKLDGFSDTVSRAKLRIEADRSERLVTKDDYTPGLPMDLRVNHGWEDPTKHEVTGKDGGPISTVDLSSLTEDQLATVEAALALLADDGSGEGGEESEVGEEGA